MRGELHEAEPRARAMLIEEISSRGRRTSALVDEVADGDAPRRRAPAPDGLEFHQRDYVKACRRERYVASGRNTSSSDGDSNCGRSG